MEIDARGRYCMPKFNNKAGEDIIPVPPALD
jgi:hypothetical protein